MSVAEAKSVAHTLSVPSKMPGYAYSLPASECRVGSALRNVEGSACFECYAKKGRYRFGTVQNALRKRLRAVASKKWREAMVVLLSREKVRSLGYFRWFDSGDLRNEDQLDDICDIARQTPFLRHWLPTREYRVVRGYFANHEMPENLLVRISAPMIDGKPLTWWPWTSTIHRDQDPQGELCLSKTRGNRCGDCRACWDPGVENVSYPFH